MNKRQADRYAAFIAARLIDKYLGGSKEGSDLSEADWERLEQAVQRLQAKLDERGDPIFEGTRGDTHTKELPIGAWASI